MTKSEKAVLRAAMRWFRFPDKLNLRVMTQWSDDPVQQKNAMQLSALLDYISELRTYAQSLREQVERLTADNAHVRQANANYREENRLAIERAEAAESSLAGMRREAERLVVMFKKATGYAVEEYEAMLKEVQDEAHKAV